MWREIIIENGSGLLRQMCLIMRRRVQEQFGSFNGLDAKQKVEGGQEKQKEKNSRAKSATSHFPMYFAFSECWLVAEVVAI